MIPKCSLCGSNEEVGHILSPLRLQMKYMKGKHMHICLRCRLLIYPPSLLNEIEKIESRLLYDLDDPNCNFVETD